jgi:DNA polymerase III epsilon subunit-like protein
VLVARTGPFGPFVGCSAWRPRGEGCRYSRDGTPPELGTEPVAPPPPAAPGAVLGLDALGPLLFLDFETTGAGADTHAIEIAALRWEGGREVARLVTLVDPGPRPIQWTSIHRITRTHLRGAPPWPALLPALRDVLEGATVVAHNARFEADVLRQGFARAGGDWDGPRLCTLALARRAHPERKGNGGHRLGGLVELHGIPMPGAAHAAYADAAVLPALLAQLLQRAASDEQRENWLRGATHRGLGVVWPTRPGPAPRLKARDA